MQNNVILSLYRSHSECHLVVGFFVFYIPICFVHLYLTAELYSMHCYRKCLSNWIVNCNKKKGNCVSKKDPPESTAKINCQDGQKEAAVHMSGFGQQ
jgi:hypothetical protein